MKSKSKLLTSILMICGLLLLCTGIVYASGTLTIGSIYNTETNMTAVYGDNSTFKLYDGSVDSQELNDNVILKLSPTGSNQSSKMNITFVNGTANINYCFNGGTTNYTAGIYTNGTLSASGTFLVNKGTAAIHSCALPPDEQPTAGEKTTVTVSLDASYPTGGTVALTINGQNYTTAVNSDNTATFDITLPSTAGTYQLNVSLSSDLYTAEPAEFSLDVLSNNEPEASSVTESNPGTASYLVTFLDCKGNTVKVEWVEAGQDATAPEGYGTYSGYTNVTAHMDLMPDSCYAVPYTADR